MEAQNIFLSKITADCLVDAISNHLMEKLRPLITAQTAPEVKKSEKYVKRKEAAGTLRISLPTLDKRTREGAIKGYRIGNQVRYKESELSAAMIQMQTCN